MRDQIDIRKAESDERAAVLRVHGLPGEFRMGIDSRGAVHTAGTAAHYDSVEILQKLLEPYFIDESVLGRDVPSAKYDPMSTPDEFRSLRGIAPVEHYDLFGTDARAVDTEAHSLQHGIRESLIVRSCADQQHPRQGALAKPRAGNSLIQGRIDFGKKAVVACEMVLPVAGRTSRQKQSHSSKIRIFQK